MAPPTTAELELLTFLSDPNANVRQLAIQHAAGFSDKSHPQRSLLTRPSTLLPPLEGKGRLQGRDGKPCDPIEDLKSLCKDQPVSTEQLAALYRS